MKVQSEIPDDLPNEITDRYDIVNNTFVSLDKGEKHSELEVEIGDIHSDAFKPQFKLKRWENECNFSVRLIDDDVNIPKIETKGNKIKFIKEKTEVHFYDVPKKGEMPECFEFEVILKEKPNINKVRMSIETKELAFYYQPELTQEEIDDGCIRPENVVGSYAVYHESRTGDYSKMGKKNYRAGKAFHIYRPKIVDDTGKDVWGELNITANLLTVEIPQKFLDDAIYPIRHAAGLTFGYETIGATTNIGLICSKNSTAPEPYKNTERAPASKFNLGENGSVTKLTIYLGEAEDTADVKGAIFNDDGGSPSKPNSKAGETSASSYGSTGWKDLTFSSPLDLNAGDYWLTAIGNNADLTNDPAQLRISHDTGDANQGVYDAFTETELPNFAFNDPFEVDDQSTYKFSIYATYTSGASIAVIIHHLKEQGLL